jgi:hypothetical protein
VISLSKKMILYPNSKLEMVLISIGKFALERQLSYNMIKVPIKLVFSPAQSVFAIEFVIW